MNEPIDGQHSPEASVAASIAPPEPAELAPVLDQHSDAPAIPFAAPSGDGNGSFVRPLSEVLLDDESDLVLASDDETVEIEAAPLLCLAPLLGRPDPLTWVFAGVRLAGDPAFGDGRLPGEWFAEEWRTETGRTTDLVIDATWPGGNVAVLKSHLKARVVRHRPDIAVLFLDRSDSAAGVEELAQFERRLVAVLSVLAEIGAAVVLVQPQLDETAAEIDAEVYFEAVSGIARERGVAHFVLPSQPVATHRSLTPDSAARHAGLALCQTMLRAGD